MDYLVFVLAALVLSLSGLCGILAFICRKERKRRKQPTPDLTATDMLHDLTTRGMAILKVDVINPANFLLRSPRS